jgi:predicted dithiol-disulfide oxidoreductase (DUF899 family)
VPGRQKYASRTDAFVRCTIEKMKGKMSTQTVTSEKSKDMEMPKVVSPKEWEGARQQLLVKEKVLTRARDALAAERRRMPWLAVEKGYEFDGPKGKVSLLDLFDSRRQLVIYRAFFEPGVHGWPDHACVGCSMIADHIGHLAHLNARNTTLVFASRAPQKDIKRLKARMGWERIPWYTITDDFDKDFGVDEWHGHNAFFRDGDKVFRTYFINSRGDEAMGTTWSYLDMTALGRQEKWEDSPEGRESRAKLDLKEIAAGPIAMKIESGIDGTNPGRNSAGVHASKESLPSCGGLIQTASMEAEIDCKLQSNFS